MKRQNKSRCVNLKIFKTYNLTRYGQPSIKVFLSLTYLDLERKKEKFDFCEN